MLGYIYREKISIILLFISKRLKHAHTHLTHLSLHHFLDSLLCLYGLTSIMNIIRIVTQLILNLCIHTKLADLVEQTTTKKAPLNLLISTKSGKFVGIFNNIHLDNNYPDTLLFLLFITFSASQEKPSTIEFL